VVKAVVETIEDRVQKALQELRPNLQADGGDIELLGVEKGVVKVKLKGACVGCPMSAITIQWGGSRTFLRKRYRK
jgi:Fe-S cluster biogenesis protein NfuA